MQEEQFVSILEQACQDDRLIFQVVWQDTHLYVYINRDATLGSDGSEFTNTIRAAIAALKIPNLQSFWLCSRSLGTVAPDWQAQIELPVTRVVQESSPEPSAQKEVISEVPEPSSKEPSPTSWQLSDYCFVRNKLLLTSELMPPSKQLAQRLQFFHDLPDCDRSVLLQALEHFFRSSELPDLSHLDPSLQKWLQALAAQNTSELRKDAIWFSRYCFDPSATTAIVQSVLEAALAQEKAASEALEAETATASEPETSPTASNQVVGIASSRSSAGTQSSARTMTSRPLENRKPTAGQSNKILFIALAIATFIIVVVLGIRLASTPPSAAQQCRNAIGSKANCQLAVQLVGESIFQEVTKAKREANPKFEEESLKTCTEVAIQDLRDDKSSLISRPEIATKGEEVLPGIFLADVRVATSQAAGAKTTRTACVLQSAGEEAELLASDEIPMEWPKQAYKGKAAIESFHRSLKIYEVFLALGAYTLFTAIGLFIASFFNMGIRFFSLKAMFQTAGILGFMETILLLIPGVGRSVGSIPMSAVMLLITSQFVKDLEVDWSAGYRIVAIGIAIVIGIRFILGAILFSFILSIV